MAQISRADGTAPRTAALAVATGVACAAAVDAVENYAFVHLISHGWLVVAMSYALVGLVTAAPVVLIRPRGLAVPIAVTLLAAPAFFCGDLAYVVASSVRHGASFDLVDYLRSYLEFQRPYTIRLELLAPLTAGALAGLRQWRVRAAALRHRGRHEARRHRAPTLARANHADID